LPEREKDKANLSIYFEVFTTGANISVNPDLRIWPASLAKLPLAMVVMKKIEEGSMKEDTLLEFTKADQDPTDTSGMDQRIGNKFPVKLLVENLLYYSSNPAYFMLKREVTDNELSGIVNAVGLEELFTPDGKVSSKEYSRLFRSLYVASYLNQENSQMLLSYMQKSTNEGYLKTGIPEDVPFAHKWGQNLFYNVHSDAGIVYAEKRPYLISVMIEAKDEKNSTATIYSQQLMKEISEKVYKYVKEEKID
jgi:beta-lactamase class A